MLLFVLYGGSSGSLMRDTIISSRRKIVDLAVLVVIALIIVVISTIAVIEYKHLSHKEPIYLFMSCLHSMGASE